MVSSELMFAILISQVLKKYRVRHYASQSVVKAPVLESIGSDLGDSLLFLSCIYSIHYYYITQSSPRRHSNVRDTLLNSPHGRIPMCEPHEHRYK